MDEFFDLNKNICSQKEYKKLSEHLIVSKDKILDYYNHITFRIESLSDYIKIVNVINVHRSFEDVLPNTVFRGMSDYNWKLEPSYKREFNYCADFENSMIAEIKTLRPKDFANELSNFDLLAKLQHFGLPTRLLDFSTNPLVALYFACRDNFNEKGRVVCTNDTSDISTTDLIESVCGLHKFSTYDDLYLEKITANRSIQSYFSDTQMPLMQKPKYSNERIIRQSAIFMIFPNKIYDSVAHTIFSMNLSSYSGDFKMDYPSIKDVTKYEKLEAIYSQSYDYIPNTNRKYPHFYVDENIFNKIIKSYKNHNDFINMNHKEFAIEFNKRMKNRFILEPILQNASKDVMEKCFCSIIIEPEYKRQILKELNLVNINEAFLFPELEYTAKTIKEKYIHESGNFKYFFNS